MAQKLAVHYCYLGKIFRSFFTDQHLQQCLNTASSFLRTSAYYFPVSTGKCLTTQLRQASFHLGSLLQQRTISGASTELHHAEVGGAVDVPAEKSYALIARLQLPILNAIRNAVKNKRDKLLPPAVPGRGVGEDTAICVAEGDGNGRDGAAGDHLTRAFKEVHAFNRRGHLLEDASAVTSQAPSPGTPESGAAGRTDQGHPEKHIASPGSPNSQSRKGRGKRQLPCEHEGCKVKWGNYAFPDGTGTRCRRHWLPGMTILQGGCEEPGCNIQAAFNYPQRRSAVRCEAHKAPGMVNKSVPVCHSTGCAQPAQYGHKGETSPSFCRDHSAKDMIYIHPKPTERCRSPGCMSAGTYGHLSNKRQKFCKEHKRDDMVSLTHYRCEDDGCSRAAKYGWPGKGVWLVCGKHKEEGMVPRECCTFEGCSTVGTYRFAGDETQRRCAKHRGEGTAPPRRQLCSSKGCSTMASFGFPQDKTPSACRAHKGKGMVNLRSQRSEVLDSSKGAL